MVQEYQIGISLFALYRTSVRMGFIGRFQTRLPAAACCNRKGYMKKGHLMYHSVVSSTLWQKKLNKDRLANWAFFPFTLHSKKFKMNEEVNSFTTCFAFPVHSTSTFQCNPMNPPHWFNIFFHQSVFPRALLGPTQTTFLFPGVWPEDCLPLAMSTDQVIALF